VSLIIQVMMDCGVLTNLGPETCDVDGSMS
jgi:hypothetical protein